MGYDYHKENQKSNITCLIILKNSFITLNNIDSRLNKLSIMLFKLTVSSSSSLSESATEQEQEIVPAKNLTLDIHILNHIINNFDIYH